MHEYEAFVYCWTDIKTNKLYVGKHRGSIEDGYIASSRYFLSEYKKRPKDFTRVIIATGNEIDMISLETAILKSDNARLSESYYNMHNNNGVGNFTNFALKGHTEKAKEKIRKAALGRKRSIASRVKQSKSVSGEKNHFFGKTHGSEARLKMSEAKRDIDGGKNPNAKKVSYQGKVFETMKSLKEHLNTTIHEVRKMIMTGEVRKIE